MIPLVYEDGDLVAVNKPAHISSIPERDLSVPSIRTLLERQLNQKLFTVHRLDKEVSGIMLFAKTAASHRYLNGMIFDREVKKTYVALVHGGPAEDGGVIDAPIRLFGSGRMGVDEKNGKPSSTRYRVLKRGERLTLLEAYPETGRRHQIRVHFYHIGHPIAGDLRYGDKAVQEQYPRLMLHAKSIEWKTQEGQEMKLEAGVPEEFLTEGNDG
ncbi:MAG: RluA family pseudouridine synthase [Chitinispirillaceae bacterium]|nr:RluA family pseudouridine synthase [Chitinispirillaceae bacterium]